MNRFAVLAASAVVSITNTVPATEYPPNDHAGADLFLADGDVIYGEHIGIGDFVIPQGATVTVRSYDGIADGPAGWVHIDAESIQIDGTLNATGSGYCGGSGAGSGAGTDIAFFGPGGITVRTGVPGVAGDVPYDAPDLKGQDGNAGRRGGTGDGPFGGLGGYREGNPTFDGLDGGYLAPESTGELPVDWEALMGSGGGGGYGQPGLTGHNEGALGGESGGAGGRGGGAITLRASNALSIGTTARILASGALGGNGRITGIYIDGNRGGDVEPAEEGRPSHVYHNEVSLGGAGAGGGILLDYQTATTVLIQPGSTIESLGGRDQTSNGGIVILLPPDGSTDHDNINISAGAFISNPSQQTTAVGNVWMAY